MINLKRYWWPLAQLTELDTGKPLARTLHGVPLVLFRDPDGLPTALHDRCPHRHAPLSAGKIINGEIACPYHGWRFAANGSCTRIPGMDFKGSHSALLPAFPVKATFGLVWVCLEPDEKTPDPFIPAVTENVDAFFMVDRIRCEIDEAAENLLDGFHTHFVHAGWIRRDSKRQTVTAEVCRLLNGIEVRYSNESLQSGIVSRFFEGSRTESFARFHLPGIAELEYRGENGLNLIITAWLTPEKNGFLRFHACIASRKGIIPAWLKRVFLRKLFGVILKQDKAMLEQTSINIDRFRKIGSRPKLLDTPLDLLGPSIRQLLKGETLGETVDRTLISRI